MFCCNGFVLKGVCDFAHTCLLNLLVRAVSEVGRHANDMASLNLCADISNCCKLFLERAGKFKARLLLLHNNTNLVFIDIFRIPQMQRGILELLYE